MEKKDFAKLKALIVEDDTVLQLVMKKELASLGIESISALTGTSAIIEHSKTRFDFILMDISMPEQDGLDAIRWIRDLRDNYSKDIPIFAVTSYSSEAHTKEILEAGFNDHFIKPFKLQQLVDRLKKII